MGFSYRKSFKAGPFRVTASKSGISYSAGVKGARVTKRANGKAQTTLSVPGTGVRYTKTSGRPAATKSAKTSTGSVSRRSPARQVRQKPQRVSRLALEEAWRSTGLPLPAHSPNVKPRKALLIAGLVTAIAEPGEEVRLIVAINKVSPTRDAMVVTSRRLLLFHTGEIRRTGQVFTVRLDSVRGVSLRKRFGSTSLVIRYAGSVQEVCGGVTSKCLTWLREMTAADPTFMLSD